MKILAIASAGGHWVQLLRLIPAFEGKKLIFLSTKESFKQTVPDYEFHHVTDASRANKIKLIVMSIEILKKIRTIKPDIIISTGAAPGLLGIVIGRIYGIKTIWVDSIANVDKISLSAKISRFFANRVYTQWSDLANKKVIFNGNVL
jgi:UDP-N-acetylglucosamine:LPS N-acetylglucosamine transferase